ncbi:MAG: SPFH domain-containing protein [Candidatus Micrarchaeota archaeon]
MAGREIVVFLVILLLIAGAVYVATTAKLQGDEVLGIAGIIILLLFMLPRVYEFKQYERSVVLRLGKYDRTVGPGWSLIFPAFEKFTVVDMRVQTLDTNPQEVQTKDDVKVKVDIVSFIRVTNPKKVVLEVRNLNNAIIKLLQGEIRLTMGKMDLDEVIEETEQINEYLFGKLKEVEEDWGFVVLRVELESIELPPLLVEARTKARSAKEFKEKVEIEASARQVALETIDKAASKLSDKTMTYLYLDALKKVSEGRSNKIIFPLELSRLASNIASTISPDKKEQGKNYEDIIEKLKQAYFEKQREALDKGKNSDKKEDE